MSLVKVTAPQPDWSERILPFLAHKGSPWETPMRLALAEGLPPLTMNFFEGLIGDTIVGNITVVESLARPVGILQHVYTNPEHRRKGICDHLMQALTDDFRARGGRALYLGTGYNTHPFRIYESFGFRGRGESGKMNWFVEDDFLTRYFAPGPTTVRDTAWGDWPLLEALHSCADGWYLRSFTMEQYGDSDYEASYPAMRQAMEEGAIGAVKELVKDDGAVVGHAYLARWSKWPGAPWLLEFFVHPGFYADGEKLLRAMPFPSGVKVTAIADGAATERMQMLEAAGFEREGVLKRQIKSLDGCLDAVIYGR
jgi:L-amino acid N-acyltransferase YncA